jgi:hypothetical protein
VKIVLVAGFFDPVQRALKEAFPDQFEAGSLVWIGQKGVGREANLADFKSRFYDRIAAGATEVLVLLAVLRGREWVQAAIESILDHGKGLLDFSNPLKGLGFRWTVSNLFRSFQSPPAKTPT